MYLEKLRLDGKIDILVNNAGIARSMVPAETVADELWLNVIDVNLNGTYWCCRAFGNHMLKAGSGSIVNIGSFAYIAGVEGLTPYLAAKSGVIGLTRGLARELGPHNIRVNCVLPGWIMTQRQIDLWLTPEAEADLMAKQCLKRKLYPDDIAKPVLFFASDEASGCTNQSYIVDGGWV